MDTLTFSKETDQAPRPRVLSQGIWEQGDTAANTKPDACALGDCNPGEPIVKGNPLLLCRVVGSEIAENADAAEEYLTAVKDDLAGVRITVTYSNTADERGGTWSEEIRDMNMAPLMIQQPV